MTSKPLNTEELCGRLDESRGYNMNTCSGNPVWPASPRAEDIRIEDIAGALSRICRYNGHLKDAVPCGHMRHYQAPWDAWYDKNKSEWFMHLEIFSVAQHSVLVEQRVREWCEKADEADVCGEIIPDNLRKLCLAALLHDAHEYILGDMIKPQKRMYSPAREFHELSWDKAIADRFGFSPALFDHPAIKEADYRVFLTEKRDLINVKTTDFGEASAEPYPERIVPVLPSAAKKMFLDRLNELYKGE